MSLTGKSSGLLSRLKLERLQLDGKTRIGWLTMARTQQAPAVQSCIHLALIHLGIVVPNAARSTGAQNSSLVLDIVKDNVCADEVVDILQSDALVVRHVGALPNTTAAAFSRSSNPCLPRRHPSCTCTHVTRVQMRLAVQPDMKTDLAIILVSAPLSLSRACSCQTLASPHNRTSILARRCA